MGESCPQPSVTTRAAFTTPLTEQGITVVDRPTHSQQGPVPLTRLTDPDGHPLTAEDHATCPGHAAYVSTEWRHIEDTAADTDQVLTPDADEDGEVLATYRRNPNAPGCA